MLLCHQLVMSCSFGLPYGQLAMVGKKSPLGLLPELYGHPLEGQRSLAVQLLDVLWQHAQLVLQA